jgi:hypothetical protein
MTNKEIAEIKPFILAFIILLVFVIGMLYQYRQICKSIAYTFKGGVVALLVMLGIIDDK